MALAHVLSGTAAHLISHYAGRNELYAVCADLLRNGKYRWKDDRSLYFDHLSAEG
jgi:hypothetical protein